MTLTVSVVMRNRNEGGHLGRVLPALAAQDLPYELVFVDNGSTDNSVALARQHGANIVSIDKFTYGSALNRGIAAARGEVIVILSAHSLPIGVDFLRKARDSFDDPRIAAARFQMTAKRFDNRAPELVGAGDDIISKGPLASGCAIRRRVWEAIRFDETIPAAEDKVWALAAVKAGHLIVSPVPCFYEYLRVKTPLERVRINHRELLAIRHATGQRMGFHNQSVAALAVSTMKHALRLNGPAALAGAARVYYRVRDRR